jgi:hypothetical protein
VIKLHGANLSHAGHGRVGVRPGLLDVFRLGFLGMVRRFAAVFRLAVFRFGIVFRFAVVFRFRVGLRSTRSGSFERPVSRFHSSKVAGEIFPSTSSCANFRRCAWLLNGMNYPGQLEQSTSRWC